MDPKEVLEKLNLPEKEADVYLALMDAGEATPVAIAQRVGLKRPTTYALLNSLEMKGLVAKVLRGKKTLFAAQHPRKLLDDAEMRLKELQATMPQLEAMFRHDDDKPRVVLYHGKSALDRAYDELFLKKGEIVVITNAALSFEAFSKTMQKLNYVVFSPEFKTREILDDSEASREYIKKFSGPYRQMRILPPHMSSFATDVAVFGNNAIITSIQKEYFSIKIESKEVADGFRTMFEAVWEISKPIEPALKV